MPETVRTAVFMDDAAGTDIMARYAAFLQLQAISGSMDEAEYLGALDDILGLDGAYAYADGEAGPDSGQMEVILALQDDDGEDYKNRPRQVLSFSGTGSDFQSRREEPEGPEEDGYDRDPDGEGHEAGDPTLDIDEEPWDEPGEDHIEPEADMPENAPGPEAETDPTLDIDWDDGEIEGEARPEDVSDVQDGPADEPAGSIDPEIEPDATLEISETTEAEPELELPAGGVQYQAEPDASHSGVVGADFGPAPEGHLEVTEEYVIHDWLDTLAAGTGLLSGVQTAEYIPPEQEAVPEKQGSQVPSFEKTPAMKQMDLMVAQKIREPEPEGPDGLSR